MWSIVWVVGMIVWVLAMLWNAKKDEGQALGPIPDLFGCLLAPAWPLILPLVLVAALIDAETWITDRVWRRK